jgi:hypothetical protein
MILTGETLSVHSANRPNKRHLSGLIQDAAGSPKVADVLLLIERSTTPGNLAPPDYLAVKVHRSKRTGQWSFQHLPDGRYTVITYDKTGDFDPVIKGGLIPEPME